MEYIYHYDSPLGAVTCASDGEALTGLWLDGQKYYASGLGDDYEDIGSDESKLPVFTQTKEWLDIYFSGEEPDFTPALSMKGTEFRKAVWEILLTVPYGQTRTYGEIAGILSKKRGGANVSARAVGNAVGHNPISVIVPCHRIVGTNGSLTGYAGGIEKKISLLELEKTDMSDLFVPK